MFGIGLPELIIILLPLSIFLGPGIVGAFVAGSKGRSKLGWFVICAVCPFCIIIIILLSPAKEIKGKYKQCPACKEFVKWGASICKYCHKELS